MLASENSHHLAFITERVAASVALQASLCHVSRREHASSLLSTIGLDPAIIDVWATAGKAAIALYSARGVMGAVGCASAGEASRGNQAFLRIVYARIASAVRSERLASFGNGVTATERDSISVQDTLTAQFIGCWVQINGYARTKVELLEPIYEKTPITLPSSQDGKTVLQEYLQARKLPKAVYKTSSEGADHRLTFTTCVSALNGLEVQGKGRSRKEAEQESARNFISSRALKRGLENVGLAGYRGDSYACRPSPLAPGRPGHAR